MVFQNLQLSVLKVVTLNHPLEYMLFVNVEVQKPNGEAEKR